MQLDPTPAQIAATLAAIAEALDLITAETWRRADDSAAGLRLTSERDGALLQLRYNGQMHRFVISGLMWLLRPDQPAVNLTDYLGARPAGLSHAITASADKPTPAIAREIARRLLPDYRADRARALARYEEQERQQRRCQEIAAELAAIVRGETRPDRRENTEFYDGLQGIHVKGQVNSPESVQLEIRYIDAETARAVLQAISARAYARASRGGQRAASATRRRPCHAASRARPRSTPPTSRRAICFPSCSTTSRCCCAARRPATHRFGPRRLCSTACPVCRRSTGSISDASRPRAGEPGRAGARLGRP